MSHVTQKNDLDFVVTVTDAAGAVIDITGFGVDFIFARRRGESGLLTLTVGAGVALTDPANGVLTASLSDVQSDLIGTFYFECITTDSSDNKNTVVSGYTTFAKTSAA
jgi:hypothetical protein